MHKRRVLWLIIVAILLLAGLLAGRTEKLIEEVWTADLGVGCALGYNTSDRAAALAYPGVDYMRLWPLPVTQPREEPGKPTTLARTEWPESEPWPQIGG